MNCALCMNEKKKYIKTPKDVHHILEINQIVCKIDDDELNN